MQNYFSGTPGTASSDSKCIYLVLNSFGYQNVTMPYLKPKLYRVYFSEKEPLFTEFYSDKKHDEHPVGIFGKRLVSGEIYDFVIVSALDEKDALIEARRYQCK